VKRPTRGTVSALMVSIVLVTGCQRANTPAPSTSAPARESASATEAPKCSDCIPVTAENFPRAESDLYFGNIAKRDGFAKFSHNRTPTPIDQQDIVRMNRDTLYSAAVFDLDAGPVTITLPDSGNRFMSMQVIDENEYTPMVVYGKGGYPLTKDKVGTRYALAAVRILANPNDQQDLDEVHKLQDEIQVAQKSPGTFEIPKWDKASQDKVRDALLVLASTVTNFSSAFGTKQQTDPVEHLVGAAAGWGGNPEKDAKYINLNVPNNDGKQVYKLTVKDVPVEGFWSVSVYNAKGYFEKNPYDAYSLNNITARKNDDGAVTVQFGGCNGIIPNCLPTPNDWNATVRLYRPQPGILAGRWKFPEPQSVS
jgi:hypothetical protein